MKSKPFLLLGVLVLICYAFVSFSLNNVPGIHENIASAIRAGNAKQLATYFNSAVEITLPGKEGTFSKGQAELVMKDFFTRTPPSSFILEQKGGSSGGSQFLIGTYKSQNKIFKAYILMKPVEGQLLIQQIQFECD